MKKAAWVKDYAADLQKTLNVPLEFFDESFTTVQAEASLRSRGKRAPNPPKRGCGGSLVYFAGVFGFVGVVKGGKVAEW
ncbi:MAG: hypothetical protein M5U34_20870 [Chloroflexi bacterium]|nr:hypothetical protein [Chloroflexota bacterium]